MAEKLRLIYTTGMTDVPESTQIVISEVKNISPTSSRSRGYGSCQALWENG
jgi:hypothetical protein